MCPDTMLTQSGTDDVTIVGGGVTEGMTCVEYERSLTTSETVSVYDVVIIIISADSRDLPYLINNQTQFIAWALGPRAAEEGLRNLAFFHTEYPRDGGKINIGVAICM